MGEYGRIEASANLENEAEDYAYVVVAFDSGVKVRLWVYRVWYGAIMVINADPHEYLDVHSSPQLDWLVEKCQTAVSPILMDETTNVLLELSTLQKRPMQKMMIEKLFSKKAISSRPRATALDVFGVVSVVGKVAAMGQNVALLQAALSSYEREELLLKAKLAEEQQKNADLESKLAQVAGKLR